MMWDCGEMGGMSSGSSVVMATLIGKRVKNGLEISVPFLQSLVFQHLPYHCIVFDPHISHVL